MKADLGCVWPDDATAGTIFDEHTLDTFARHIWQSVLVDERDLCILVSGYH